MNKVNEQRIKLRIETFKFLSDGKHWSICKW
jgi:hypothetical protein